MALLITLAITSNGADVNTQSQDGWKIYNHWKTGGKLAKAEKRGSQRGDAVEAMLETADLMAETMGGYAALGEFLSRKGTVRELRSALKDTMGDVLTDKQITKLTNGELIDEVVPFSLVFGPKLGSFFNNMNGDFSTVTMDRWFMRTFGRAMGTQMKKIDAKDVAEKKQRLLDVLEKYDGDILQRAGLRRGTKDTSRIAASLGKFFSNEANRRGLTDEENEIRLATNALFKIADGAMLIEAPETGMHRRWIRAVMADAPVAS
jgi:hypothetical protein